MVTSRQAFKVEAIKLRATSRDQLNLAYTPSSTMSDWLSSPCDPGFPVQRLHVVYTWADPWAKRHFVVEPRCWAALLELGISFCPAGFIKYEAADTEVKLGPVMDMYSKVTLLPQSRPSIRLLEISSQPRRAGSASTLVHGHLRTYPLDDAPSYEALSYAWGSCSGTRRIRVNGLEFPISARLHDSLEQILENKRGDGGDAFARMWIDGICIN